MMKIYLSGPISQNPGYREEFQDAAIQLRRAGYEVINPVELVTGDVSWKEAMKQDLKAMFDCDGVAILHTRYSSKGMAMEMMLAGILGMPCKGVAEFISEAAVWSR